MKPRIDVQRVAPAALRAHFAVEQYVRGSSLEPALLELVRLRASYLNGCAYCVDMHTRDAHAAGETDQRLHAVPVWRETPFYGDRERAALALAEAVTALGPGGVPDDVFDAARAVFDEREVVDLVMAIVAINGWNRLAITFRTEPGSYRPAARAPAVRAGGAPRAREDAPETGEAA